MYSSFFNSISFQVTEFTYTEQQDKEYHTNDYWVALSVKITVKSALDISIYFHYQLGNMHRSLMFLILVRLYVKPFSNN